MSSPYTPPQAPVQDPAVTPRPNWLRTILAVPVFGALALILGWVAVPPFAGAIAVAFGAADPAFSPLMLLFDIVLTTVCVFSCAYAAARLARRNVARAESATLWGMWKNGSAYRPEWVGVLAAAQRGDLGVSARTIAD